MCNVLKVKKMKTWETFMYKGQSIHCAYASVTFCTPKHIS